MAPSQRTRWLESSPSRLAILGSVAVLLYAALLVISFAFREENPPLLAALGLLGVATVIWWVAVGMVLAKPQAASVGMIVGFSVAFRLLMLPSWPIQEIDFYRYLWDGRVTLHSLNPYAYSPYQVEIWLSEDRHEPGPLEDRANIVRQSESVRAIFDGVHYRDIPTAYPPLAQLTFAVSGAITPAAAPVYVHILLWKVLVVTFDLGTLALLIVLLRRLNLPAAWCIAYGWCPLAMKEFANSGHFDALAVFLTVAAVLALVEAGRRLPLAMGTLAAGLLALAVLAKSYPVVLLPVVAAFLLAKLRWRAVVPGAVFAFVLLAGYVPFAGRPEPVPVTAPTDDLLTPHHPGAGLGTFLGQWEMNDFLFLLVRENLRCPRPDQPDAWLCVVPATWRSALHQQFLIPTAAALDVSPKADLAILVTQIVMGAVLLLLSLRWAWQVYRQPETITLLRAVFLTLAWAWLLSAAQNPWYLLWSLPFLVFAGKRSWFLLPGLVLLYYFRFWLERNGSVDTFDYGVVGLEYLPFFIVLAIETWRGKSAHRDCQTMNDEPRTENGEVRQTSFSVLGSRFIVHRFFAIQPRRGMGMLRVLLSLAAVAAVLGLAVLIVHANRPRVRLERPADDLPRVPLDQVDHTAWDALLQKYVDDQGLVAYRRWKANDADVQALDRYLARLGAVDLQAPSDKPAQIAYWINAYNALTIKGILREYPTSSIRNHTAPVGGYNIWRDLLIEIDGRSYSLDDIEHANLRHMGEPRIHFALVCAAKGCPPLANRAWTGNNLEAMLTDRAERFFARPTNFRGEVATRTVFLSELLDWYGTDFAPTPPEQARLLRRYFPMASEQSWIDELKLSVKYLEYDWSLNEQP
jgi:hypothetical protein